MLREELKKIKRLTDEIALEKEAAIIAIKSSLPQISTYMPLGFCLDFRGFPYVVIDSVGINAYEEEGGTPTVVVGWKALTVDEIYSLYEKLNSCSYNAITALQNQIASLNIVEEYFKL